MTDTGEPISIVVPPRTLRHQVAHQMGHSKIETTKNVYGHLFAQDRASLLAALNQAVGRLCAYENSGDPGAETAA